MVTSKIQGLLLGGGLVIHDSDWNSRSAIKERKKKTVGLKKKAWWKRFESLQWSIFQTASHRKAALSLLQPDKSSKSLSSSLTSPSWERRMVTGVTGLYSHISSTPAISIIDFLHFFESVPEEKNALKASWLRVSFPQAHVSRCGRVDT